MHAASGSTVAEEAPSRIAGFDAIEQQGGGLDPTPGAGRRWNAYAASDTLPIDNNPVESAIRPVAIGKKHWLFTGS